MVACWFQIPVVIVLMGCWVPASHSEKAHTLADMKKCSTLPQKFSKIKTKLHCGIPEELSFFSNFIGAATLGDACGTFAVCSICATSSTERKACSSQFKLDADSLCSTSKPGIAREYCKLKGAFTKSVSGGAINGVFNFVNGHELLNNFYKALTPFMDVICEQPVFEVCLPEQTRTARSSSTSRQPSPPTERQASQPRGSTSRQYSPPTERQVSQPRQSSDRRNTPPPNDRQASQQRRYR